MKRLSWTLVVATVVPCGGRLPPPFALAALAALGLTSLAGCGNTPPSVDAFSFGTPSVDAAGNTTVQGTITVSDADGDKITRLDLTVKGPSPVIVPSFSPPGGAAGAYPFQLTLPAAAAKGAYEFSVVALDEPGGSSAAKTASVTIK